MLESVPDCSGEGNTSSSPPKTINPAIKWVWVLNNYTDEEECSILLILQQKCRYFLYSKEVGEQGTPHLQGYLEFYEKSRPLTVFKNVCNRINFQKAIADRPAQYKYITKSGPIVNSKGLQKPVKIIQDEQLFSWQKHLIKIISQPPGDREIYWYWSKTGGVGKTTFCKYLTVKHGAICLEGKQGDIKNGIIEYQKNNEGQLPELVVVSIPRAAGNEFISYSGLENIKDMYFYSGKYEGGMVCGNPPHLIIFCNEEPDYSKLSEDRWVVKNIDPPEKPEKNIELFIEQHNETVEYMKEFEPDYHIEFVNGKKVSVKSEP